MTTIVQRSARIAATGTKYGIERRCFGLRETVEQLARDAVYAIGQPEEMYAARRILAQALLRQ